MNQDYCKDLDQDWLSVGREVFDIEVEGLQAVRDRLGDSFVAALRLIATSPGRVVVTGLGKSGLVGRKLAATFSSTGTASFFLHPVEGAHGDLGMIRQGDVVLAISNSGETDELNAILPTLRSLDARLIALTGKPESTMARMADVVLDMAVPREACPLDLAPTASTTASLTLGDALAVCLMKLKAFDEQDFARFHPGGALGQRLQLCAGAVMHRDNIPLVTLDAALGEALAALDAGGLGAVLVVGESERLAGILTDGDVRRLAVSGGLDPVRPVAEVMVVDPLSASPDQPLAELLDLMESKAITVLPMTDPDKTVRGIIHLHDLLGKGRLKFSG